MTTQTRPDQEREEDGAVGLIRRRKLTEEECAERDRQRRNREHLDARWEYLRREHPNRWICVYGDCQVVIDSDLRTLRGSLSEAERRSAVRRFTHTRPLIFTL